MQVQRIKSNMHTPKDDHQSVSCSLLAQLVDGQVVADCSLHHTEISLVSDWCPNLSFYSMMQPLAANLQQVAEPPSLAYNPNHTYLAVVNSDGDNLQVRLSDVCLILICTSLDQCTST